MKKWLWKFVPYVVAVVGGIAIFVIAEDLIEGEGLTSLTMGIASGLVSIPLVFIFFNLVHTISDKRIKHEIIQETSDEINRVVYDIFLEIRLLIQDKAKLTTGRMDDILSLRAAEFKDKIKPSEANVVNFEKLGRKLLNIVFRLHIADVFSRDQIETLFMLSRDIGILSREIRRQAHRPKSRQDKEEMAIDIETILDEIAAWIEKGKADALINDTVFTFKR